MSDKVQVEVVGKSKSEIAYAMAQLILISIENKNWENVKRDEYLRTVVQCVRALNGIDPN